MLVGGEVRVRRGWGWGGGERAGAENGGMDLGWVLGCGVSRAQLNVIANSLLLLEASSSP
jgi:hypothetical protein